MAGSLKGWEYEFDNDSTATVIADESNVEAANGAAAAQGGAGSQVVSISNCRRGVYRNAATGATRIIPFMTQTALAAAPAVLQFFVSGGGTTGSAVAFALVQTIGEAARRYVGSDTGLLDGDN